jgi:hypothetical protein
MDVKENLSRAITKEMVLDIAPEESDFFEDILENDKKANRNADEYLGFGGDDTAMVFVTTIIFGCCKEVVAFIWENAKDSAGQLIKDSSKSAQEAIAKWIKGKITGSKDPSPIQLSKDTITDLTRMVLASPDAAKLTQEQQVKLTMWVETRLAGA